MPVEERINLEESIETLKTLEQQVIRLFFFEDLTQSEIAQKIGDFRQLLVVSPYAGLS